MRGAPIGRASPIGRGARAWLLAALVPACVVALSCGPYPRDPASTYERAAGGVLRVGVTDAAPWVVRRGEEATGIEPTLIREFAASIGARVEWHWGPQDEHLESLETFELDIVAAGLTAASPWKKRVALTRPYRGHGGQGRVLAAPPGENRFIVELERFLHHRGGAAH